MKAFYTIFTGEDNQFYFNLKARNNEIILQSEGYVAIQGATNGINSVQKHCTFDDLYKRKTSRDGSPYFVLTARNGEIIGVSEMYSSVQMMEKGIESVKSNGVTTKIKHLFDKTIIIHINKERFKVTSEEMTGAEILNLAGFSYKEYTLFLINGNSQEEISYDRHLDLHNGMHFQAIISEIKFG